MVFRYSEVRCSSAKKARLRLREGGLVMHEAWIPCLIRVVVQEAGYLVA